MTDHTIKSRTPLTYKLRRSYKRNLHELCSTSTNSDENSENQSHTSHFNMQIENLFNLLDLTNYIIKQSQGFKHLEATITVTYCFFCQGNLFL